MIAEARKEERYTIHMPDPKTLSWLAKAKRNKQYEAHIVPYGPEPCIVDLL